MLLWSQSSDEAVPENEPSDAEVEAMDITETGDRIQLDRLGLDAPLSDMNVVNDEVNPPTVDEGYRLRDHVTTYVVLHSLKGAEAPGNVLFDMDSGESTVRQGDVIDVAGDSFEVTETRVVNRVALSREDEIWGEDEDRLVVITCLQRTGGGSVDNVLVMAERAA